ncbi:Ubiquitin carboxyl-terminal hydrolase 16 like protein [Verticillium longisporum]|nr:Ubiquitin carboxyl-terminal hydrolase 16 like protein [Verticillium longisporum]
MTGHSPAADQPREESPIRDTDQYSPTETAFAPITSSSRHHHKHSEGDATYGEDNGLQRRDSTLIMEEGDRRELRRIATAMSQRRRQSLASLPEGQVPDSFDSDSDPAMDPTSKSFDLKKWLQNTIEALRQEGISLKSAGVAFKDLSVSGTGDALQLQQTVASEIEKSSSDSFRHAKTEELKKLQHAIAFDPDDVPDDVTLPDSRYAPKRRIARSARITKFPKVLTIHLSRSIYETQASTKNSAKVSFPESLPLGGLTDRRRYKLIALVTHKGSHHSGHYESFRRQTIVHAPYPNLNTFQPAGIYSKSASPSSTPRLDALSRGDSPAVSTPDLPLTANSSTHSLASDASPSRPRSLRQRLSPTSAPRGGDDANGTPHRERDDTASLRSVAAGSVSVSGTATPVDGATPMAVPPAPRPHRKRKTPDRWWRISDEKIREAKTGEVLGMQREVYLLFYELDKDDDGSGGGGDAC